MKRILVVEDQFVEANNLKLILTRAGYQVCSIARSVTTALSVLEKEKPDLVLVDIFLQGEGTGIDLGKVLNTRNIPFVYLSANSNAQILEAAKPTRPYGFMAKPFRSKDVLIMLDVALYLHENRPPQRSVDNPKRPEPAALPSEFTDLIGKSDKFVEMLKEAGHVGPRETSVLILGESGTGKELIANSIHRISPRRNKPFVVINCGALPTNLIESELFGHEKGSFTGATNSRVGKFALADGGTVFLDEIGELSLDLQVKFLRVLQEKEIEPIGGRPTKVNIRVIAATNKDLEKEVAAGRFRIDLYYRLNVFPLQLPPLRERKDDIPLLAQHFLKKYNTTAGGAALSLSKISLQMLMDYHWPGNIRELENIIQRNIIFAKGEVIESLKMPGSRQIPAPDRESPEFAKINKGHFKTMEENEREHILAALESCGWKKAGKGGAAEILNLNVNTLNSRIKKLGIKKQVTAKKD